MENFVFKFWEFWYCLALLVKFVMLSSTYCVCVFSPLLIMATIILGTYLMTTQLFVSHEKCILNPVYQIDIYVVMLMSIFQWKLS